MVRIQLPGSPFHGIIGGGANTVQILLYMYLGSGTLLALLALPLLAKKIKPNPLYGFRVKRTLEDPDLWYQVNYFFAWRQLFTGIVTVIAALGLYFVPGLSVDTYALACLGVFALAFGVAMVQSILYMKSL